MDAELVGDVMATHGSISLKFRNFINCLWKSTTITKNIFHIENSRTKTIGFLNHSF